MPKARTTRALFLSLVALLAGCGRGGRDDPAVGAPKEAHASGIFRDVAVESGIDYRWGHNGRSPLDIRETIGHGCSFLDYDQDGLMDVLVVGERTCSLFRNRGGGRFENVTAKSGLTATGALCGVAVGDYDNDGFPDLYITGYGRCALYHNRGGKPGPAFEEVTDRAGVGARGPYDFVTAAAFVDLDGDGKLDLIAGRYIRFTPQSRRFCSYGGVLSSCRVTTYDPDTPFVYRNNGDGTFTDVTKAWGFDALHGRCLGLAVCEDDSKAGPLIYFSNDELPCDLMARRQGRFVNIGVSSGAAYNRDGAFQAGMGADWGDYNNDGRQDLAVATFQNEPKTIYRADGSDLYTEVSGPLGLTYRTLPYIAWSIKFIDYDNDGWLDLFITNGHVLSNAEAMGDGRTYAQPLQLFRNQGGATSSLLGDVAGAPFSTPIVGRGASVGDFDNDGRQDLLVVNEEGRLLLLHNECKTAGHWLGIRLVGVRCNRDGIGARVRVTAGGRAFVRDEQLCGGYISGQDPRLHFGLGQAARADKIEVFWPDGSQDVVTGADPRLAADRYITVKEGEKPRSIARQAGGFSPRDRPLESRQIGLRPDSGSGLHGHPAT